MRLKSDTFVTCEALGTVANDRDRVRRMFRRSFARDAPFLHETCIGSRRQRQPGTTLGRREQRTESAIVERRRRRVDVHREVREAAEGGPIARAGAVRGGDVDPGMRPW